MTTNRQAILKQRPEGFASNDDFDFVDRPAPEPGEGEFLVSNEFISLDPAMRGWMTGARSYVEPLKLGDVMRAIGCGHVVCSSHPDFKEGAAVSGTFGVQQYAVSNGQGVVRLDVEKAPLTRWIGGLGMTGMTAYFGLLHICRPSEGETVLFSGAVGSMVGQIAKIKGCRVVGIAGGAKKCAHVVNELGFDAYADYKAGNLPDDLRVACPDRYDEAARDLGKWHAKGWLKMEEDVREGGVDAYVDTLSRRTRYEGSPKAPSLALPFPSTDESALWGRSGHFFGRAGIRVADGKVDYRRGHRALLRCRRSSTNLRLSKKRGGRLLHHLPGRHRTDGTVT